MVNNKNCLSGAHTIPADLILNEVLLQLYQQAIIS